jgi:hypothetical protein
MKQINFIESLIDYLHHKGFKCEFLIDRLHIHFGARHNENEVLKLIKSHHEGNEIQENELSKRHDMNRMLILLQPTKELLKDLRSLLHNGHVYTINYIELALDCATDSKSAKDCLQKFILRHITHTKKDKQGNPKFDFGNKYRTYYTGSRKDPMRLVMYDDCESKIIDLNYCSHLEWRLKNLAELEKHDILILEDVIHFNHVHFWNEHLELRKLNANKLGEMIHQKSASRQFLTRIGNKEFEKILSLQGILNKYPLREAAFPRITTDDALYKLLDTYLPA